MGDGVGVAVRVGVGVAVLVGEEGEGVKAKRVGEDVAVGVGVADIRGVVVGLEHRAPNRRRSATKSAALTAASSLASAR